MRTLLVMVSGLAFIFLAPRPARAQCCGNASFPFTVDCGCGIQVLYQCDRGAGNTFMAYVNVQCGLCPNQISTYAPAGYCYNGVVVSSAPGSKQAAGGTLTYVDAYVRDCTGRYVAVRVAVAMSRA